MSKSLIVISSLSSPSAASHTWRHTHTTTTHHLLCHLHHTVHICALRHSGHTSRHSWHASTSGHSRHTTWHSSWHTWHTSRHPSWHASSSTHSHLLHHILHHASHIPVTTLHGLNHIHQVSHTAHLFEHAWVNNVLQLLHHLPWVPF